MSIKRRKLIRNMLIATVGSQLSLKGLESAVGTYENALARYPNLALMDSFEILRQMSFGQALANTSETTTDTSEPISFITIKVMNHIHSPLCFNFPEYTGSISQGNTPDILDRISQKVNRDFMSAAGLKDAAVQEKWKNLGLNKWFANILQRGYDFDQTSPSFLSAGEQGTFSSSVAFQTFLHLNQNDQSRNHSFVNTCLPNLEEVGRGGDLNFHLQAQNLIESPFGICCLNMGNTVETTDSIGRVGNHILGGDLSETVANGRTVNEYISRLIDSIGTGFIDENLRKSFNNLVGADTSLIDSLANSREDLISRKQLLTQVGLIENSLHNMSRLLPGTALGSNMQAFKGQNRVAENQFLSQCVFASRALELPGLPIRNFSLLLNIFDIDGAPLDFTAAQGGGSKTSEPYTYIEGMRQLAMGLNILSHTIAKTQGKVYVLVVSEGGRDISGKDNDISHAFLMGPNTSIGDHFYRNQAQFADSTSLVSADPNRNRFQPAYSGGERKAYEGTKDTKNSVQMRDLLHGIVRLIESEKNSSDTTTTGMQSYVDIKRA